MKNTLNFFRIIVIISIIIFSTISCDLSTEDTSSKGTTPSLEGKWDWGSNFYEFNGENFTVFFSGTGNAYGTFTYTTTHITFNPTHYYQSGSWVDWNTSSSYADDFATRGINGNPVPYRFEKSNSSVYLYIDSGYMINDIGYEKQ